MVMAVTSDVGRAPHNLLVGSKKEKGGKTGHALLGNSRLSQRTRNLRNLARPAISWKIMKLHTGRGE
jgi:hypothetical protein